MNWNSGGILGPACLRRSARDYVFGSDQENFAIVTTEGHGWSQSAERGDWSPAYGRQERATVVTFGTVATLPAEFATLLLPNAALHEGIGRLERFASNSTAVAYRYVRAAEEHLLLLCGWCRLLDPRTVGQRRTISLLVQGSQARVQKPGFMWRKLCGAVGLPGARTGMSDWIMLRYWSRRIRPNCFLPDRIACGCTDRWSAQTSNRCCLRMIPKE